MRTYDYGQPQPSAYAYDPPTRAQMMTDNPVNSPKPPPGRISQAPRTVYGGPPVYGALPAVNISNNGAMPEYGSMGQMGMALMGLTALGYLGDDVNLGGTRDWLNAQYRAGLGPSGQVLADRQASGTLSPQD